RPCPWGGDRRCASDRPPARGRERGADRRRAPPAPRGQAPPWEGPAPDAPTRLSPPNYARGADRSEGGRPRGSGDGGAGRGAATESVPQGAVDTRGQEDDAEDQHEAVDGLGDPDQLDAEVDAEEFAERDGERGSHGRPQQRVHPAQHNREDDAEGDANARHG